MKVLFTAMTLLFLAGCQELPESASVPAKKLFRYQITLYTGNDGVAPKVYYCDNWSRQEHGWITFLSPATGRSVSLHGTIEVVEGASR